MSVVSRYEAHIGKSAEPVVVDVERGHIRRFADAIADANPIYRDEQAAARAGHARIPAPPTFAIALRAADPREGLGIDYRKLLHAQQSFEFVRPIYAGDRLTLDARISEAWAKETRSGLMDFITVETSATDERGAHVYTLRSTVAVRQ